MTLNSDRPSGSGDVAWESIKDIFYECLQVSSSEVAGVLDDRCRGDAEKRREVIDLLGNYSTDFLEYSSAEVTPSRFPADFPDGTETIGPYKILEFLGEGGMGVVYLAERMEPYRQRVALKLIKLGMDTREVVARFEAERQALALLSHPNIAKVLDAGQTERGRPYFVMEYVLGIPLTKHCDKHRLSLRERLELFRQICDAVQHAHQKGIIHRDIKPSNVLVAYQDGIAVPRLIDFGVAKATNQRLCEQTVYTEQGRMIGTPAYMSPEQAEPTAQDIDTRSDIYSLGVVLYELIVGSLPFDWSALRKKGYAGIAEFLRTEDPPRPSTRLSQLPDRVERGNARRADPRVLVRELKRDLDWIVLKAMDSDRGKRYASASELAGDVGRYLRHEPVIARPPTVVYRLRKFSRKHRVGVSTGLVVLVLALLGWGGYQAAARRSIRVLATDADAAIKAGDLEAGRAKALLLAEREPDSVRTAEIQRKLRKLERETAIERSRKLRIEAEQRLEKYRQLIALRERWLEQRDMEPTWRPVWERPEELATWRRLNEVLDRMGDPVEQYINGANLLLLQAVDVAPLGSEERDLVKHRLMEIDEARHREDGIKLLMSLRSGFLRQHVRTRSLVGSNPGRSERGQLSVATSPKGTAVYCFRFEELENRLVPVPFHPRRPEQSPPGYLVVEKNWDDRAPFAGGDRMLEVDGQRVVSLTDLAESLRGVKEGVEVSVKVVRRVGGKESERKVDWIPFPKSHASTEERRPPPGLVIDPYVQFGLTFEAYPLACTNANLIGSGEGTEAAMEVDLPRGSYLLVARKAGYEDTRFPVVMDAEPTSVTLRLFRDGQTEIPAGFVYVPGGPGGVIETGGDAEAFNALESEIHKVSGFFMSRHEVTMAEWLEFVNDPEIGKRTDDNGAMLPTLPDVTDELHGLKGERVPLLVKDSIWQRDAATGTWSMKVSNLRKPAIDINHFAAREYAHWRTQRDRRAGKPWRYRLPTDPEWEWAARGADGRIFVWGDYRVWSFCASLLGSWHGQLLEVGTAPFDESVFGVRDMAGGQHEHTTGQPVADRAYRSYRGGSWKEINEQFFHIASRNTIYPTASKVHFGLRLVAEVPD